jgi:acetone carboxylase gamma subunit
MEDELASLEACEHENSCTCDIAMPQLFKNFIWFRTLLLRDGALLYTKYPQASLPPFNLREFREFAAPSADLIAEVEARGPLAVKILAHRPLL